MTTPKKWLIALCSYSGPSLCSMKLKMQCLKAVLVDVRGNCGVLFQFWVDSFTIESPLMQKAPDKQRSPSESWFGTGDTWVRWGGRDYRIRWGTVSWGLLPSLVCFSRSRGIIGRGRFCSLTTASYGGASSSKGMADKEMEAIGWCLKSCSLVG